MYIHLIEYRKFTTPFKSANVPTINAPIGAIAIDTV